MSERQPTKPIPQITPVTRPFWKAAAQGRLVMQRCEACDAFTWTPKPSCVECGSSNLAWAEMSGRGTVYSFTVIRQVVGRGMAGFEPDIPYALAWVDLEEGPRMLSSIVGCSADEVKIDMAVGVTFEQVSADIWLPKFEPA